MRATGGRNIAEHCVEYKSGYKYQLFKDYQVAVAIKPANPIATHYIDLDQAGTLTLRKGYAWDGPSGPTIDTRNFMRGSLVHDALYQLMRMGELSAETDRETADEELRRMCREDGMSAARAWWVFHSVRQFGKSAASGDSSKPVLGAPRQDCVDEETPAADDDPNFAESNDNTD